jgi:hypothetical protein
MIRLNNLAKLCSRCDIVAHTGDCVSQTCDQLPAEWDKWPQRLKLSVPGNHDYDHTFDLLQTWHHRTPWACRLEDLVFVGLDPCLLEHGAGSRQQPIDLKDARGVVALLHRRPEDRFLNALSVVVGSKALLILHGHEHPNCFSGSEWDESGQVGSRPYFRSKVCSSVSRKRGLGHIILWTDESFACMQVQGPKEPALAVERKGLIVEHPKFGRGLLLAQEGAGDEAKVTVNFPFFGEKRLLARSPGLKIRE